MRKGRAGRRTAAALLAAALAGAGLAAVERARGASGAARADLDAVRRTVAQMESEYALSLTRKPYLVLDLGGRTLRYRLMGMTTRELPLEVLEMEGLLPAPRGVAPDPSAVAAIFTLEEKEGDPRLSPLTPDQIEAGLDDENAADVLPPEPPFAYALAFRQPVSLRIRGASQGAGLGGVLSGIGAWWKDLWGRGAGAVAARPLLSLSLGLEGEAVGELYRALVPGERFLVLAPSGLLLPAAGQEAPRAIRPSRPLPAPPPAPPRPVPGVPFQIPPSVPADAASPAAPPPAPGETPGTAPPPAPPAAPTPAPAAPGEEPPAATEEEKPAPAERVPETPAP